MFQPVHSLPFLSMLRWSFLVVCCTWSPLAAIAQEEPGFAGGVAGGVASTTAATYSITDQPADLEAVAEDDSPRILEASFLQPQPLVLPSIEVLPEGAPSPVESQFTAGLFGGDRIALGTVSASRQALASAPSRDLILGSEAAIRITTDGGNLLGKSPAALGTAVQRRTPIVSDPRVRGGRVGKLAASGSYWVPARLDLDTMLSKIDSRIVQDMIVVKGPYSVRYGPGFEFVDVQLLPSPRFDQGWQTRGSTSFDYQTNGEQVYGRQQIWGGTADRGYRVGYGHRTGNDYRAGDGTQIPASYNSRDFDVALGYDLAADRALEFHYLRLDQTNVEFPGQAFDIDWLVTDGYSLEYTVEDQCAYDEFVLDAWYNHTRFDGSAQRAGKRRQFPFYDFINFVGFTDVHSTSTGARTRWSWGDVCCGRLTAGADFYYVKQELNEITSGRIGLSIWNDANSPVPKSYWGNPGGFLEYTRAMNDRTTVAAGGRIDASQTNVIDDPAKLAALGIEAPQQSLGAILGSDQFEQSFTSLSGYLTAETQINPCWSASVACGYAERPPNLTELYAAQTFMFLLQNGLNTVTGDPRLARERRWQVDAGLRYDNEQLRMGARGYHAWVRDYITFENLRVFIGPFGTPEQVNLKFVNTELATLWGGELYAEWDATERLTAFATLEYVEGTDHRRNGSFATQRASGGNPSTRSPGLSRGAFSGVAGAAEEPLPGLTPLESRAGVRYYPRDGQRHWFVELSGRLVDGQDRVAASLLESTTPGFAVWDLRTAWQPYDDVRFVGGIENFTDRAYRESFDFRSQNGIRMLQPGINFYAGGELTY